jgi:hypothetical protein
MANENISQGSFSDFYQGAVSGDSAAMVNMLAYYLGVLRGGGMR